MRSLGLFKQNRICSREQLRSFSANHYAALAHVVRAPPGSFCQDLSSTGSGAVKHGDSTVDPSHGGRRLTTPRATAKIR